MREDYLDVCVPTQLGLQAPTSERVHGILKASHWLLRAHETGISTPLPLRGTCQWPGSFLWSLGSAGEHPAEILDSRRSEALANPEPGRTVMLVNICCVTVTAVFKASPESLLSPRRV